MTARIFNQRFPGAQDAADLFLKLNLEFYSKAPESAAFEDGFAKMVKSSLKDKKASSAALVLDLMKQSKTCFDIGLSVMIASLRIGSSLPRPFQNFLADILEGKVKCSSKKLFTKNEALDWAIFATVADVHKAIFGAMILERLDAKTDRLEGSFNYSRKWPIHKNSLTGKRISCCDLVAAAVNSNGKELTGKRLSSEAVFEIYKKLSKYYAVNLNHPSDDFRNIGLKKLGFFPIDSKFFSTNTGRFRRAKI